MIGMPTSQRVPTRHPAASRPSLDRLSYGLRLIAENPAIKIDQQQRRPLAETDAPISLAN
jgi:hypothetical protein